MNTKTFVLVICTVYCMCKGDDIDDLCEEPHSLVCDDVIRIHPLLYYYNRTCQQLPGNCDISNETTVFSNLSHCKSVCGVGSEKHDGKISLVILLPACGGGALVVVVVVIVTIIIIKWKCHSRTRRYYEQVLALINEEDPDDDVIDDVVDDVIDDDDVMIT